MGCKKTIANRMKAFIRTAGTSRMRHLKSLEHLTCQHSSLATNTIANLSDSFCKNLSKHKVGRLQDQLQCRRTDVSMKYSLKRPDQLQETTFQAAECSTKFFYSLLPSTSIYSTMLFQRSWSDPNNIVRRFPTPAVSIPLIPDGNLLNALVTARPTATPPS